MNTPDPIGTSLADVNAYPARSLSTHFELKPFLNQLNMPKKIKADQDPINQFMLTAGKWEVKYIR